MGIPKVIVPPRPGLGSALGLLATDLKVEAVVSWLGLLERVDLDSVSRRMESLQRKLRGELADQEVTDSALVESKSSLDLRYLG